MVTERIRDLVIVGTGPAGLTAALYAARYKLDVLAVGSFPGGLMTEAHKICNYPSEIEISGVELGEKMLQTAKSQGAEIAYGKVKDITRSDGIYLVHLEDSSILMSRTILLTNGTVHRKLVVEGESKLVGKGVSYCATCDAMFYKNKTVAVIGGNNSALTAALYLADVAEKVYLIYRGKELGGEPSWVQNVLDNEKIEVILTNTVKSIEGESFVQGINLSNPYNGNYHIDLNGVFVEIGSEPKHGPYVENFGLAKDENNYIKVGVDQKTSVEGIWAAGDITTGSNGFRQIITACSEGAIAAENIFRFIKSQKIKEAKELIMV